MPSPSSARAADFAESAITCDSLYAGKTSERPGRLERSITDATPDKTSAVKGLRAVLDIRVIVPWIGNSASATGLTPLVCLGNDQASLVAGAVCYAKQKIRSRRNSGAIWVSRVDLDLRRAWLYTPWADIAV